MRKSILSTAVLLSFAGSALAQGSIVNQNESFQGDVTIDVSAIAESPNRYAGIGLNAPVENVKMDVSSSGSLTIFGDQSKLSNPNRVYGIVAEKTDNSSLLNVSAKRDVLVNIQATSVDARGIRANGGPISVSGTTIDVTANTKAGQAIGVEAWFGSDLNLQADEIKIEATSETDRVLGVQNGENTGHAIVLNAKQITINTKTGANSYNQAVYINGGTTVFNGNTTITANGGDIAYGVSLESDASAKNPSITNFGGASTIIEVDNKSTAIGIRSSGEPSQVNFNGEDVNISVTSSQGGAVGVQSQYSGSVNAEGNLAISVKGKTANGIFNGLYAGSLGSVNVLGHTSIIAEGDDAFGVRSLIDGKVTATNKTGVSLLGGADITVTATSEGGLAVGIDANNKVSAGSITPTASVLVTDANVLATSAKGEAFGVRAEENSDVTLSGTTVLKAQGNKAVGLSITTGASVNTIGDASISATNAYIGDSSAQFNVSGIEKSSGSLLLNGNVSNEGTINLTNSSLELTGATDKVLLGTVNTVGTAESSIALSSGDYLIDEFTGENKSLILKDLANTKAVTISEKSGTLNVVASASSNDQYKSAQEAANALLDVVNIEDDKSKDSNKLEVIAGAVNNGVTADITTDASGNQILENYTETKNDKLEAFSSVSALSALTLRHEMNSLTKRMGELRDAPAGVGAWVRGYGSEMEYGAQNIKAKNNSIQVGSDYTLGDWKVGAAFSYTDGESTYDKGSADNKNYGIAVYGTWFVPCGAYVDLMAKYNRLDNDFALNGMNGSFDNDAFTVSAETGYRFNFMDGGVFVEPQVGLSYGFIKGETIKTSNGVTLEQDDYNSLIGRVGVRTGFKFPKDKGTIYARVSGVYDFDGEVNGKATLGQSKNTFEADLGGSWLEMGVGANFNWTKNTYTYIDFERTNGGDVKENYRWNVGVRHNF